MEPTSRNVFGSQVIAESSVWRVRTGYALRFGQEGNAVVGVVGEVLGLPGRDAHVIRAGLLGRFAVSRSVEAIGLFVPPIHSPDSIGIAGGDFAELGVRWRWASD